MGRQPEKQRNRVCFSAYLHNRCTNSSIEPNPVDSRNDSISGDRAKDDRTQSVPLLSEVAGMNLSKEYCKDHSKHSDQVYLTPVLRKRRKENTWFFFLWVGVKIINTLGRKCTKLIRNQIQRRLTSFLSTHFSPYTKLHKLLCSLKSFKFAPALV